MDVFLGNNREVDPDLEEIDSLTVKKGVLWKKHEGTNWKEREFKLTKRNKIFYMKKGVLCDFLDRFYI